MNVSALAAIKARLTLSSNDAHKNNGMVTIYAQVVRHLIRRYITDTVVLKDEEEVQIFRKGSLTSCNFSQTSWDLTVRSGERT